MVSRRALCNIINKYISRSFNNSFFFTFESNENLNRMYSHFLHPFPLACGYYNIWHRHKGHFRSQTNIVVKTILLNKQKKRLFRGKKMVNLDYINWRPARKGWKRKQSRFYSSEIGTKLCSILLTHWIVTSQNFHWKFNEKFCLLQVHSVSGKAKIKKEYLPEATFKSFNGNELVFVWMYVWESIVFPPITSNTHLVNQFNNSISRKNVKRSNDCEMFMRFG